jgi:hypothetical protein
MCVFDDCLGKEIERIKYGLMEVHPNWGKPPSDTVVWSKSLVARPQYNCNFNYLYAGRQKESLTALFYQKIYLSFDRESFPDLRVCFSLSS